MQEVCGKQNLQEDNDDFTFLKANSFCYNSAVAVAVRTSNPKVEYNKKSPNKKSDTDLQKDCDDVSQVTTKDSCIKISPNLNLCNMETDAIFKIIPTVNNVHSLNLQDAINDDLTLLKANSSCYNTAPVAAAVRTSNPKVEYNK